MSTRMTAEEAEAHLLDLKDKVIEAALTNVPFDGWTMKAAEQGAVSLSLAAADANRAFPQGRKDMAKHFGNWLDRKMVAKLQERDLDDMRIRDRIAAGVRTRLEILTPHREAVRRLATYLSLPGNQGIAAKMSWSACDHIWYAAGDRATDFNHYTKRGLLFAVYTSTLLYWLEDRSDDFEATWSFLDRRISDVMKIPGYQAKAKKALGRMPSPLRLARKLKDRVGTPRFSI